MEAKKHVLVEAIPRTRCDSTSDSEKIIDQTITLEDKQTLTEEEIIAKKKAARPFAGKGRPLSEVIPECWRNWTHMMKTDAKNGFIDAQVDYALALWRGDVNMKINVDRKAAYRWIAKAVSYGQHCLFARGGCGASNCHKCHAIILKKKMEEWFKDEEIRAKCASQFVALHTPPIIFQILSFCDATTLMSLMQLNLFWSSIIKDDRAWAHLDMPTLYPAPQINFPALTPPHLHCKVCKTAITPELPRYEAVLLPNLFERHFMVCKSCFEARAGGIIAPYTLHGTKLLQLQWELKETATQQLYWEKHAERKLEIPGGSDSRVVNSVKVAGMDVPSKAGGIYTEAKASETRVLQAAAAGMRSGLHSVKETADAIQRHGQEPEPTKKPEETKAVAKVVQIVDKLSVGKSVMAAVSAKPRREFEESVKSPRAPESTTGEGETDEDDLALLAQMLIAGEDVTLVTEKDKRADRKWHEGEQQRIRAEQERLRLETEERQAQRAVEDEQERINTMNALAMVQHVDEVVGDSHSGMNEGMSEEHARAGTLAEYLRDFPRHRKHIASWNLENQVMVVYPTHSCSLFKQGDDHDSNFNHTKHDEVPAGGHAHDVPAMPLLYELLAAQWSRARGYRYLKLRHLIQTRLLNVLEARDRGEDAVFYTIKKRKEV